MVECESNGCFRVLAANNRPQDRTVYGSYMSLENLVKEVQRKIGRNLLLFQQLEHLLKYLVAHSKFAGCSSDIENRIDSKKESLMNQTMGQVIGQYVEGNDPKTDGHPIEPEALKEAYISFVFCDDTDLQRYEEKKETLNDLVIERNNLVHHLLPEFDPNSIESCEKIERSLDEQSDRIRVEIKNAQSSAKTLVEMTKSIFGFLSSEDGQKEFLLSFLRQDPLVILLADITTRHSREDGWTSMNTAGNIVKQDAPYELELLHKGVDHKTLKSLMLKTEMFEFKNEDTNKGGTRALYRLRAECLNNKKFR